MPLAHCCSAVRKPARKPGSKLPLVLLARMAHLAELSAYGTRAAGLAILVSAAWSLRNWKSVREGVAMKRSPFCVGVVHGVTGASALLLLLPASLTSDGFTSALYLAAFTLGSTASMTMLTELVGRLGSNLKSTTLDRVQRVLLAGSFALGAAWLTLG